MLIWKALPLTWNMELWREKPLRCCIFTSTVDDSQEQSRASHSGRAAGNFLVPCLLPIPWPFTSASYKTMVQDGFNMAAFSTPTLLMLWIRWLYCHGHSYALQDISSIPGFLLPTRCQSCMPTHDQWIPSDSAHCPVGVRTSVPTSRSGFFCQLPDNIAMWLSSAFKEPRPDLGCSAWVIMAISVLHLSTGTGEHETKWPEALLHCPGLTSSCSGSDILFTFIYLFYRGARRILSVFLDI